MKIKDTLNMPKTDYSMKAQLPVNEPKWQKEWEENNYYQEVLKKNKGKEMFILHDGPPYANGNIHTGHVLNKILKDIIIRSKNMNGFCAPIVFGWDTHGLPIENAMLKQLKKNAEDFDALSLRQACANYAKEQVAMQKEQFFSVGLLADKNEGYLTLYPEYEKNQILIFKEMVKRNLIYQGLKPVYWSWSSQSALADAEIEYKDVKSPAIYVGFDFENPKYEGVEIVIWTTTPWTIPANKGISVGADFEYSIIKAGNKQYLVASDLVEDFVNNTELGEYEVVSTLMGRDLENELVLHPITGEKYPVMLGEHVTVESGTGCVHTAPAHGEDDFNVGKLYNLEVESVVDAKGYMNDAAGEFAGMFYDDANKAVTQKLESLGKLVKLSFIKHSYPHDWRTKKPVFYRATKQWFCTLKPIKQEILNAINETSFMSEWGRTRLYNMLDNRDEWCISRQRKWGVPLPIFYDENEEPILDENVIEHVAELFGKYGSDIWFDWEAKDLLPEGYTTPGSPNNIFTKETDIMDVWFDSGSSHQAVIKELYNKDQADLYLEGSDQYRGWFNSSLITSVAINNHAPYKQLLSHGFVLDGKGSKMSKSLGNTIEPSDITSQRGADILRLWVASVDYQSDVNLTEDLLTQVSETYRKYRNTIRFMLGNVSDFNKEDLIDFNDLELVDQYMLIKLSELTNKVIDLYNKYDFTHIVDEVINYITRSLSGFYLDFIKDIIYVCRKDDKRRRQIQTVLYYHLEQLIQLMAPIIPHTAYEAQKEFNGKVVFLEDFKTFDNFKDFKISETNLSVVELFDQFLVIRDDINKELEEKRRIEIDNPQTGKKEKLIGSSLKARVVYQPKAEYENVINILKDDLQTLCIVSSFEIDKNIEGATEYETGSVLVERMEGCECARCRKMFNQDQVSSKKIEEEDVLLCQDCLDIVNNWEC